MMPITARIVFTWSVRLESGCVCVVALAGETWAIGLFAGEGAKTGGLDRLTATLPPGAGCPAKE